MRHSYFGKKLSRTSNERKRLFQSLIRDLFRFGSITTTKAKAKAIQPMVDKLITKAKIGSDASYRQLMSILQKNDIVKQLIVDAKERFSTRTSGYTRCVKLSNLRQDAAEQVNIRFVDEIVKTDVIAKKEDKKTTNTKKEKIQKGASKSKKAVIKK